MWLQTLAQVAVFATIVGVFIAIAAWGNGRRTTRQIRETVEGMQKETNKLLSKLSDQHEAMLKILERMEVKLP